MDSLSGYKNLNRHLRLVSLWDGGWEEFHSLSFESGQTRSETPRRFRESSAKFVSSVSLPPSLSLQPQHPPLRTLYSFSLNSLRCPTTNV